MTLGSHQRTVGKSQNHLTPWWLIEALGPFDLDPCAADPRPWDCATINYTRTGLDVPWRGFVWLNPPFHRYEIHWWIERLAKHNNGIALLHARTETTWFATCWSQASALLFLRQRIIFCKPDGTPATTAKGTVANSGAPPVLVAFGAQARYRLHRSKLPGAFITNWSMRE